MKKKHLFLVCNAHLDPIYMWQLEDGLAEALSTFRTAARFCEEEDGFVFNHNEALLYEAVREYEPALFRRIQKLVQEKKWHILGGWYVQPDCNMPSAESLIRQISEGKRFFRTYFDEEPTVAVNFDSFGHSQGLVQILKKSGYTGYLFCRPNVRDRTGISSDDFIWRGFDGSEILGHCSTEHYSTSIGHGAEEIEHWLDEKKPERDALYLWGIGDHGGGPSKADVQAVRELIHRRTDVEIVHSTPEAYFASLAASPEAAALPVVDTELNPVAEGSFSTLVRIKQKHRQLENTLYMAEKMLSHAHAAGLCDYPQEQLTEALRDLLLIEFHDSLPGSIIRDAETDCLRTLDHGIEIAGRLQRKAFFALTAGEAPLHDHELPIFAYNPHPYPVTGIFTCEYSLPQDFTDSLEELEARKRELFGENTLVFPEIYQNGVRMPSQLEEHRSHKWFESRKKSVFYAELPPSSMTRFDCRFRRADKQALRTHPQPVGDTFVFDKNPRLRAVISTRTGQLLQWQADGQEYLAARPENSAFSLLVMEDRCDAYGWGARSFPTVLGRFSLMTDEQVRDFLGFEDTTAHAVRVIEQGEVRTVVQVLLQYGTSAACLHYILPHHGTRLDVRLVVYWNEKGGMLKLSVPTALQNALYQGEHAGGTQTLRQEHQEVCAHRWAGLFEESSDRAVLWGCDSGYGSDAADGEIRVTLLRSPLYLSSEFSDRNPYDRNRFAERSDGGERTFRLWMQAGSAAQLRTDAGRLAESWNEAPFLLSFNPSGEGEKPAAFLTLDAPGIRMTAAKKAEDGPSMNGQAGYLLHLLECAGKATKATLSSPLADAEIALSFTPFELKTVRLLPKEHRFTEEDTLCV